MPQPLDEAPMVGDLVRVLSANALDGAVHGRYQNGRIARFHVTSGPLPTRGDLILLGQDRWERAPEGTITDMPPVGVVRRVMDDDSVLMVLPPFRRTLRRLRFGLR